MAFILSLLLSYGISFQSSTVASICASIQLAAAELEGCFQASLRLFVKYYNNYERYTYHL